MKEARSTKQLMIRFNKLKELVGFLVIVYGNEPKGSL